MKTVTSNQAKTFVNNRISQYSLSSFCSKYCYLILLLSGYV